MKARGRSCDISDGYWLCGNWDMWQKKGEECSPLNTSPPQSEAVATQGSLRAALVSLNHERLPIVWEKVGSGTQPGALRDPGMSAQAGYCSLWMNGWRKRGHTGSVWGTVCMVNRSVVGSFADCRCLSHVVIIKDWLTEILKMHMRSPAKSSGLACKFNATYSQ